LGGISLKKILIIVVVLLVGGIYGAYKIMDNANKFEKKQEKLEATGEADNDSALKEKPIKNQTAKIGGVQYDIGIDEGSTEGEVIDVMHKMTHQKVKASEKWGAIPMTNDSINDVFTIVTKSDFAHKDKLLAILEKWKNGSFENADSDHNYFWNYQGGTIGEARGTLSLQEEEEFIKNNFPTME
jgi:hypothetical protein